MTSLKYKDIPKVWLCGRISDSHHHLPEQLASDFVRARVEWPRASTRKTSPKSEVKDYVVGLQDFFSSPPSIDASHWPEEVSTIYAAMHKHYSTDWHLANNR
ncbi:hypothetical protein CDAR_420321 [Caerostris darwini]|uniref:Uncharacterized protein n=1 Tax=Caerostris darwini TaxID=1538125 RepID=A0AAV4TTQ6_9ARAC|nr:hypothetical protein CDAR_420321 [Caerostris darwini]